MSMNKSELLVIKELVHALDEGTYTTDEFLSWILKQLEESQNEKDQLTVAGVPIMLLSDDHDKSSPSDSPSSSNLVTPADSISFAVGQSDS